MIQNWGFPALTDQKIEKYKYLSFEKIYQTPVLSYLDQMYASPLAVQTIKVVHLIASIGGYFKAFSPYVGALRMISGAFLLYTCCLVAWSKHPDEARAEKKEFLHKYFPFALGMVARGLLEVIPYGFVVNFVLDTSNTAINHWLLKELDKKPTSAVVASASAATTSAESSSSSSSSSSTNESAGKPD